MHPRCPRIACLAMAVALGAGTLPACGVAPDPNLASITRDAERVAPEPLLHRAQTRLEDPVRRTVDEPAAWRTFLQEALGEEAETVEPTADFSSSFVAVAGMGRRPTGGFNISIPDAYVRRDSMFILVRHTMPGMNCIVPQAETSPLVAVALPRLARNVRFVVEERTMACS